MSLSYLVFHLGDIIIAKALLKQNRMEARYNDVQNGTSSRSLEQEEETKLLMLLDTLENSEKLYLIWK